MNGKLSAILLMGPTASGKTSLAVAMAQALDAEIISVDSALVYRGMDIGTAKPTPAQRGGIPHHLIDILEPSQTFSTGRFLNLALEAMADICSRGKVPLLVGGTMLYFSALSHGLAHLPPADQEIRKRLDAELLNYGKEAMHLRLASVDPIAAARIHINDPQRVQRALEVYEISGRPISEFFRTGDSASHPFRLVKLIVAPAHRQSLHLQIAERFQSMLAQGFLDEVKAMQLRGDLDETMPSVRCVGYRQAWAYLNREYGYQVMQEKAVAATRQLAKRQFTWLRKENDAYQLESGSAGLSEQAVMFCRREIDGL